MKKLALAITYAERKQALEKYFEPWRELVGICGRHMQATEDDPPRFRVRSFPAEEWARLQAIGRLLKRP